MYDSHFCHFGAKIPRNSISSYSSCSASEVSRDGVSTLPRTWPYTEQDGSIMSTAPLWYMYSGLGYAIKLQVYNLTGSRGYKMAYPHCDTITAFRHERNEFQRPNLYFGVQSQALGWASGASRPCSHDPIHGHTSVSTAANFDQLVNFNFDWQPTQPYSSCPRHITTSV